jgi:amidophosphoribosyltransferase
MCGFIGIFGPEGVHVAPDIYEGLLAVQHRGQDAAGIITFTDAFHVKKGLGLVIEVFNERNMARLQGNLGVGHVRYPTVGAGHDEDAQPFHHTYPVGVAMAHNGNVTNFRDLTDDLNRSTRLNSSCDLEVILWVFQDVLAKHLREDNHISADDVFKAVRAVFDKVQGAYSVVATIAGHGLVAFRDPYGIKPIVFGEKTDEHGKWFACASESVVLDVNGFTPTCDVGPGEVIYVDKDRRIHQQRLVERPHHPCAFEWVYFARPDSVLDHASVYRTRRRFGAALAEQWKAAGAPMPDIVVPIPDSSRDAAMTVAESLGRPYREGLVKNRYIGRTFIMPNQESRRTSIRRKLNPMPRELAGKDVLLVDDSIVRGNTSRRIVSMVREAGARKVYFAVTSPPLIAPCPYGIDMASKTEFVATGRTVDEIARSMDVDYLLYLDRESMNAAIRAESPKLGSFCNACFTGDYPTGDITVERLQTIEQERHQHGDKVPTH